VTFIALREAIPDVQRLAGATQLALVELGQSVRPRRSARVGAAARKGRKESASTRRAPLPRRPPSV
jgi:hypothetical protein